MAPEMQPKRLDLLSQLIPQARVIALLVNPKSPTVETQIRDIRKVADAKGLELLILRAGVEGDFESAFASVVQLHTGGLVVAADPFLFAHHEKLVALAAQAAVPAIYEWREFAAIGGLISYGSSLSSSYRQAGAYVGRILKGEKPVDLAVQQPTRFELVVNLKTARELGLTIPPSILARADEVIE